MTTNVRGRETSRGGGIIYTDPSLRISPFLDPVRRIRLAHLLKWIFLFGLLMVIAWIPSHFYIAFYALRPHGAPFPPEGPLRDAYNLTGQPYYRTLQISATVFAAVIATCLPRLFLPRTWFGRWVEATEAFRDWVVVGIFTGLLYTLYLEIVKAKGWGPQDFDIAASLDPVAFRSQFTSWFLWRVAYGVLPTGLLMMAIASRFQHKERAGSAPLLVQLLVQGLLIVLAFKPMYDGLGFLADIQPLALAVGIIGGICCIVMIGALLYAYAKDSRVVELQKKGIKAGKGPVNLNITVIGGRKAGKTCFLAGGFWEWTTRRDKMGPFRIESLYTQAVVGAMPGLGPDPLTSGESPRQDYDIKTVATNLYVDRQLPAGNVSCQDLPFELKLHNVDPTKEQTVARFSLLDYPGGALVGMASNPAIARFKEHLGSTDGLLLVADMSTARRGVRDQDFLDVMNAYHQIMDYVLKCNGKNRVVPVALVLTKCDEFFDSRGQLDMALLASTLRQAGYTAMEDYWKKQSSEAGPGFIIWSEWYTSALTYTRPADNDPNRMKEYVIAEQSPGVKPTNCAAPLLWLTREMLRWNVTLATDLTTFILGATPGYREQIRAIEELEPVIREMAE